MRAWFDRGLDTVVTFWRVERRDGVALGFTSHDRDLWFDGLLHRAAPGMVPSAIRRTTGIEPDSAEMAGALDHAAIRADDLAAGRFDGAAVRVGLADWESGESEALFAGAIGAVGRQGAEYTAELLSAKAGLDRELVPRTAPTCRAAFCGPGCSLSPARFTREATVVEIDRERSRVRLGGGFDLAPLVDGHLRWVEGPQAGLEAAIVALDEGWPVLDRDLAEALVPPLRVEVREGCDHTLATCAARFANAVNFQGEPFLPGNDLLTRYGNPAG
ncbi:MAG: DUF2163 domain-containing protein [Novosphingobium sp.]|nr:DUF2163 domain-containing protein [Novosphingobium sp.]